MESWEKGDKYATIRLERAGMRINLQGMMEALAKGEPPSKPAGDFPAPDSPVVPVWRIIVREGTEPFPEHLKGVLTEKGYQSLTDETGRQCYKSQPVGPTGEEGLAGAVPYVHQLLIEHRLMGESVLELKM